MKKLIIFLFVLLFFEFNCFALFVKIENIEEADIRRVLVLEDKIFVASKNSLFISKDRGNSFEKLFVFKDEEINHIFFSQPYLYIATSRHLYRFNNSIEKIFSSSDEFSILTAIKFQDKIYIGTSSGLYFADENTLNFNILNSLSNNSIYSLDSSGTTLYVASSNGIYSQDIDLKRLFIFREKETIDQETSGFYPNIIKVDTNEDTIYLGTNKGLYYSKDKGKNFKKLYLEGIGNSQIYSLALSKNKKDIIYVGTSNGFFKVDLKNKEAICIYEGLETNKINWIDFLNEDIYLATKNGLFKSVQEKKDLSVQLQDLLKDEPSIEEIQKEALRYNEVSPDKINRWRNMLKMRAFFPSVNLSYSKTIYGTAGGATYEGKYLVGPKDWSVSFSWDVANLVWNSYEDDVDTRSRLNTQLRLDILDEINRVYFERLRIKKELMSASLSGEETFKKNMRLKELEAILDGYTGGYFTKKTKLLRSKNE